MYKYLNKLFKSEEYKELTRERLISWRREPVILRIENPTRLDRAHSLGYKAKQGFLIARVRIGKGSSKREAPSGGRKPSHAYLTKHTPGMNLQHIAEIGGCYYSARLAVNEYLNREKRQAGAVILRETHPGYLMPVGVWNVRESVRAALKTAPKKFSELKEALNYIARKLEIPIKTWINSSSVLRKEMHQKRVLEFLKV